MTERNPPRRPGPQALGSVLQQILRRDGLGKKALEGRRLAQKTLFELLGAQLGLHADVTSVKTGVVTVVADSSALFQELEGYRREELLAAFRKAGLQVSSVRVRLGKPR